MSLIKTCSIVDIERTTEICGSNKTIAYKILSLYCQELPIYKEQISQYYENLDHNALKKVLHKLRGSCAICHSPNLAKSIKKIEKQDVVIHNDLDEVLINIDEAHRFLLSKQKILSHQE